MSSEEIKHPAQVHIAAQETEAIETLRAETIERPPGSDEGIPFSKTYAPLSFPVIALLIPASIFGVLARLGLVALMNYDGSAVFPLAYAQAVGCLVMGFGLGLKAPLGQTYGPLYIALTTGFCGSLTTFSSWQLQVFDAWINAEQVQRSGFANFLDGVALTTITLSLSLASLSFGKKIASVCAAHFQRPPFLPPLLRYGLSGFSLLIYAATLIAYFFLPPSYRHQVTAALVFSFPGTLTRYLLSTALNPRLKALPVGTLAANISGTVLLAAFHALQSTPFQPSQTRCDILQGLVDGYCGCLTTVSTFAAELGDLGFWKACRYALISWILGQVAMLLIFGSSLWTGSVEKQITCSF